MIDADPAPGRPSTSEVAASMTPLWPRPGHGRRPCTIIQTVPGIGVETRTVATAAQLDAEHFKARVEDRADSEARMYLAGQAYDNPMTREQKDLIEGVLAPEYAGRTVLELLQNGHDAHDSARTDGYLEVVLDLSEGEHGTLYAVNGGIPVGDTNFARICGTGLSPKRPDQGIGNKGIGFKSVLQFSEAPEVYSARAEAAPGLDGYRFRFATPGDFDAIADRVGPDQPGLADELRRNLAALRVPVPLSDVVPPAVARYAKRGVSTVVRLPLRSAAAQSDAVQQINEISGSAAPFNLFLRRVSTIALAVADGDETVTEATLIRSTKSPRWSRALRRRGVHATELRLADRSRYLLATLEIPEREFLDAVQRSCDAGELNESWREWQGNAAVDVAVPLDQALDQGLLYTFLPMGSQATAPLPAFVNAPFAPRADRRSLSEAVAVNSTLLDALAKLCARLLVAGTTGEVAIPATVLVDLASWAPAHLERLEAALEAEAADLWELPFLPRLGFKRDRTSLAEAYHWSFAGKVMNGATVARAATEHFVDPTIGDPRLAHLDRMLKSHGWLLEPDGDTVGACVEAVASHLVDQSATPATWATFYDDLAALGVPAKHLKGGGFVIAAAGARAGGGGDGSDHPVLYFSPQHTDDTGPAVLIPNALATRFRFASSDVPTRLGSQGRGLRPGREWLERHGLVREYRTDNVLQAVGVAMAAIAEKDADNGELWSCLSFAASLVSNASRDVSEKALKSARLLVPCAAGWRVAEDAVFGLGWGGPHNRVDDRLSRLLSTLSDQAEALADVRDRLVREPRELALTSEANVAEWRVFLESIGVRHGLWPVDASRGTLGLTGRELSNPGRSDLYVPGLDAATKADWIACARTWPGRTPAYESVRYTLQQPIPVLPGQSAFKSWPLPEQRLYAELIIAGLDNWPEAALRMQFTRAGSDPRGASWPTPLYSFLASAPWVPQTRPNDRATVDLRRPSEAWWLAEAETPDFLPAQPGALRATSSPRVVERLQQLGVRLWDSRGTATARLDFLAERVALGHLAPIGRDAPAVRRAAETAWIEVADAGGPQVVPERVLVMSAGSLTTLPLAQTARPTLYIIDVDGTRQESLLAASPLSVLPVRDGRRGARLLAALRTAGCEAMGVSEVHLRARVDGIPVEDAEAVPLIGEPWEWLPNLLAAAADLRTRAVGRLSTASLRAALDRIEHTRLVVGRRVQVVVDDHEMTDDHPSSMIVPTDEGDLMVVGGVDRDNRRAVLDAMSTSLALMISAPQLADTLRLACRDLLDLGGRGDPTAIATALNVGVDDVRASLDLVSGGRLDVSPYVRVVMCLDAELAAALFEAPELTTDAHVTTWLEDHLPDGTLSASDVRELAERGTDESIVERCTPSLPTVNQGLRALGLTPFRNDDGQDRAFQAYLQGHAPRIRTELRERFRRADLTPDFLARYVELRDRVTLISPDPEWAERHWALAATTMEARVQEWLDSEAPPHPSVASGLPPVDETVAQAQKSLRSVLGRLPAIISAWTWANGAEAPARSIEPAGLIAALTSSGRLDFGAPTPDEVLASLHSDGAWPDAMPLATGLTTLGLSQTDVAMARERLRIQETEEKAAKDEVHFAGEGFTGGDDELMRLYELVRSLPLGDLLEADPAPADLPYQAGGDPGRAAPPGRGGGAGVAGASQEKTKNVGLIGEVLVGRWLERHFGQSVTETWQSSYRTLVLGDGKGSDSLGYDFRVATPEKTLLIEVKASLANDTQFQLGESEVRRAQDLRPGEEYRIVFVPFAGEPARARLIPLPNPFAAGGLQRYRVLGRALRLQFALDVGE